MIVPHWQTLRHQLHTGDPDAARRAIEQAVAARRGEQGDHTAWGILCEDADLLPLAFEEFRLALRDDPGDREAALRLVPYHRERGDCRQAAELLAALLRDTPADEACLRMYVDCLRDMEDEDRAAEAIERAVAHGLAEGVAAELRRAPRVERRAAPDPSVSIWKRPIEPDDADCMRMLGLFGGYEGAYARQWVKAGGESGFSRIDEPLTVRVIRKHLRGEETVGVYALRSDKLATFLVIDLEIGRHAMERARADHAYAGSLRETLSVEGPRLLNALRDVGLQPLFEHSGHKGRHFWLFFDEPLPADFLDELGTWLTAWQRPRLPECLELTYVPRRTTSDEDGDLVKLPLGVHRRTGFRCLLLTDEGEPRDDSLAALHMVVPMSRSAVRAALERVKRLVEEEQGGKDRSVMADATESDVGVGAAPSEPRRGPVDDAPREDRNDGKKGRRGAAGSNRKRAAGPDVGPPEHSSLSADAMTEARPAAIWKKDQGDRGNKNENRWEQRSSWRDYAPPARSWRRVDRPRGPSAYEWAIRVRMFERWWAQVQEEWEQWKAMLGEGRMDGEP